MQLTRQDVQIIEKVVQTPKGLFLARFAVLQIGADFKWKLLDMVAIASDAITNTVLRLIAPIVKQINNFTEPVSKEIVSPYTNFDFFVSQPTRAPNR